MNKYRRHAIVSFVIIFVFLSTSCNNSTAITVEQRHKFEKVFQEAHSSISKWHVIRTEHIKKGIKKVANEGEPIVPYLLELAEGDRDRGGWPYWALLCGSLAKIGGEDGQKALQEIQEDTQANDYVREWAKRALEGEIISPDDR